MTPELADLLDAAQRADRLTRIEWRTPIARHGAAAIDAVAPWIHDPELGAFAVRVVEEAANHGAKPEAIEALSSVGNIGPSAPVLGDIQAALGRLAPRSAVRDPRSTTVRLRARDGWDWPGFQLSDFGRIDGTTWRRRADPISMVPLVLRPLLELDSGFSTWPIYGSPEVQFAIRDRYQQGGEWGQGWRASKLVVYANGPTIERPDVPMHVVAGWYVEKGDGSPEFGPVNRELWDWPRFLEMLADPVRRGPFEAVVAKHRLRIGDYIGGGFTPKGAVMDLRAHIEDGDLVVRSTDGRKLGSGWGLLLDRLEALDRTKWHDLHVWREWSAEAAIAMGQPFALREVSPVLVDLARVYLATVWPSGR